MTSYIYISHTMSHRVIGKKVTENKVIEKNRQNKFKKKMLNDIGYIV